MNKADIIKLLETNDRAVARALVVLNEHQTATEQSTQETRYLNGEGFRPCHARMGTSMAGFYTRNGYLTAKQVAYWRAKMKCGNMRIGIYAGQLLKAAEVKAQAQLAQATKNDPGNLAEELMVLEEQFNDYQDSDDFIGLSKIKTRIDAIRSQLKEYA